MTEINHKQTIDEIYEDALFAKLMNEHAQIEGTRLLEENERLKNNADFHLPNKLHKRCINTVDKAFKAKKMKAIHSKITIVFKRIAIIVLICAALFTGLWCTASAFRESVFRLFTTRNEEKMDMQLRDSLEEPPHIGEKNSETLEVPEGVMLPAVVPDGYILTSFSSDEMQMHAVYTNNSGDQIMYKEFSDGFTFSIDTEDAEVENVSINGYEGVFVSKEGLLSVNWGDTDRAVLLRICSKTISKEDMLKMARSVEK